MTPESNASELSVSVAMCTYNGAQYLREQLASIATQTLLPDELVVCDDGSSDATLEMLEDFARDVRFAVRIHRNPQRLGFALNFSSCMQLCQGDLIVLTDQDDRWSPTRIERTVALFSADPLLTFTFSDAPLIDLDGRSLAATIYSNLPIARVDRTRLATGKQLLPAILRWGVVFGCTMAVRSSYRSVFLPVPEGWSHDEWISLTLSALGPSARLSPVTEYRQHAAQLVSGSKWTLLRHFREMLRRGEQVYAQELLRYRNGVALAAGNARLQKALLPALESKVSFLEARQRIRSGERAALSLLLRLLTNGSYARLSAGVASAAKDLGVMLLTLCTGSFSE